MHIDNARELKARLRAEALTTTAQAAGAPAGVASVGISVLGRGADGPRYGLAVRWSGPRGEALLDRTRTLTGGTSAAQEVDVRDVGRVVALTAPTADRTWTPGSLQRRVRPLHPGLSIAHEDVTAGTLGAFVRIEGSDGVYALSNNHVLADSDRAALRDAVLQPGPADGGGARDRVGQLARAVPLEAGGGNAVDAAIALLEDVGDGDWDPTYPVGRLVGWAEPDDEVPVEKVGRTTGWTTGRISAIELDDVAVEYPVGVVSFDGQVEVTGSGGPFSAGGDSGSLVYRPDTRQAVGLLFAGSERGGEDGTGLTFCNPIGLALERLGATLLV
ncbi:hypothetical protein [Kineococcus terrestris]|uniref:hypothetical protein n=1 Tax=Kineococcus terrestris TaxID=2044856 RepID=UPI0034DAC5B3